MAEVQAAIHARAIFSESARAHAAETDEPIHAIDERTGVRLAYRQEADGNRLTLTRDDFTLAVACDLHQLNLVASLLLDGLDRATPRHPPYSLL